MEKQRSWALGLFPQETSLPGFALAAWGGLLQALSGYWDVYSHRVLFRGFDPWWNPAHLALYAGGALVALAVISSLRNGFFGDKVFGIGFKVIGFGAVLQAFAGVSNEVVHRFVEREPSISPPHALFVVGMLFANFGSIAGLTTFKAISEGLHEASTAMIRLALLSLAAGFLAIWLVAAGSTLYLAGVLLGRAVQLALVFLLGAIAALVFVPAMRVVQLPGFVAGLGGGFAAANWFFLVLYAGLASYFPIGAAGPLVVDAGYHLMKRKVSLLSATVFSGLAAGLSLYYTYHPFAAFLYKHSNPLTLNDYVLMSALGGLVGAILSNTILGGVTRIIVAHQPETGIL